MMEHNIKRLLAFSSVENIGIILIGLGVSFIAISKNNQILGSLALCASLFHTFNHTLFKGGLFLGAGAIQYSTHTKDIEKLGGLTKKCRLRNICTVLFTCDNRDRSLQRIRMRMADVSVSVYKHRSREAALNILSIQAAARSCLAWALAAACFVNHSACLLGLRERAARNAKEVPSR
jgi:hypothetical protein